MNRSFFLAGAVLLLISSGWFLSRNRQSSPRLDATAAPVADSSPTDREEKDMPPAKNRFAEDRPSDDKPAAKLPAFSGAKAIEHLKTLCNIGPRLSGSEGMAKQQTLLIEYFEGLGATVTQQKFVAKQPSQLKPIPMMNLIVTWNPKALRRVILCGHYDTRPFADQEPDPRNWGRSFASANDGTSTTALMMEMGRHMKEVIAASEVGIDFVIFDGEEYIIDKLAGDKYFLGSDYFANAYKKEKREYRYIAGILLDLFAGKDAEFMVEVNSWNAATALCESFWGEARVLGVERFVWKEGPEVQDDHLALNRVGIPCIDIIDFGYKHWHRLSDTPDRCSPESMEAVARVFMSWVRKVR